jgi:dihydroxyacetone kinase-like protein
MSRGTADSPADVDSGRQNSGVSAHDGFISIGLRDSGHLKKILDDPRMAADDAMEGMVLAKPDVLRRIPGRRIVVRKDSPVAGKVGLICGGGSGHEPAHVGYVGRGMLDAAVMGDVFTSPAPSDILTAIQSVDGGAGVLLVIWNYGGDVMNFTLAEKKAKDSGYFADHVIVNDDVAIKDVERRRGVGTTILVQKIAGAIAEHKASLQDVKLTSERVISSSRSMGVALTPCIVPAVGKPTFTIGENELELGIGIHGEPGVQRAGMMESKKIAEYLVENIASDLNLVSGERIAVLAQGMGGTSNMEKFIFYRDIHKQLSSRGITITNAYIGEYTPSMEMVGVHLTVLRLDEELRKLLEEPTNAPGWHAWS